MQNHNYSLTKTNTCGGIYRDIHNLMDSCWKNPPRNTFYTFLNYYKEGYPTWILKGSSKLIGFCYGIPNGDGVSLESIMIHPSRQGEGLGKLLVSNVTNTYDFVSLSTTIPEFFYPLGFRLLYESGDKKCMMFYKSSG